MTDVRNWTDVQRADGYINNVAPQISVMWGGTLNGNAAMNIAWEHYRMYGDPRILSRSYETGKRWLGWLEGYTQDGLLTPFSTDEGHFLGDWLRPGFI
jgi:alpha-L-rhamnosidase